MQNYKNSKMTKIFYEKIEKLNSCQDGKKPLDIPDSLILNMSEIDNIIFKEFGIPEKESNNEKLNEIISNKSEIVIKLLDDTVYYYDYFLTVLRKEYDFYYKILVNNNIKTFIKKNSIKDLTDLVRIMNRIKIKYPNKNKKKLNKSEEIIKSIVNGDKKLDCKFYYDKIKTSIVPILKEIRKLIELINDIKKEYYNNKEIQISEECPSYYNLYCEDFIKCLRRQMTRIIGKYRHINFNIKEKKGKYFINDSSEYFNRFKKFLIDLTGENIDEYDTLKPRDMFNCYYELYDKNRSKIPDDKTVNKKQRKSRRGKNKKKTIDTKSNDKVVNEITTPKKPKKSRRSKNKKNKDKNNKDTTPKKSPTRPPIKLSNKKIDNNNDTESKTIVKEVLNNIIDNVTTKKSPIKPPIKNKETQSENKDTESENKEVNYDSDSESDFDEQIRNNISNLFDNKEDKKVIEIFDKYSNLIDKLSKYFKELKSIKDDKLPLILDYLYDNVYFLLSKLLATNTVNFEYVVDQSEIFNSTKFKDDYDELNIILKTILDTYEELKKSSQIKYTFDEFTLNDVIDISNKDISKDEKIIMILHLLKKSSIEFRYYYNSTKLGRIISIKKKSKRDKKLDKLYNDILDKCEEIDKDENKNYLSNSNIRNFFKIVEPKFLNNIPFPTIYKDDHIKAINDLKQKNKEEVKEEKINDDDPDENKEEEIEQNDYTNKQSNEENEKLKEQLKKLEEENKKLKEQNKQKDNIIEESKEENEKLNEQIKQKDNIIEQKDQEILENKINTNKKINFLIRDEEKYKYNAIKYQKTVKSLVKTVNNLSIENKKLSEENESLKDLANNYKQEYELIINNIEKYRSILKNKINENNELKSKLDNKPNSMAIINLLIKEKDNINNKLKEENEKLKEEIEEKDNIIKDNDWELKQKNYKIEEMHSNFKSAITKANQEIMQLKSTKQEDNKPLSFKNTFDKNLYNILFNNEKSKLKNIILNNYKKHNVFRNEKRLLIGAGVVNDENKKQIEKVTNDDFNSDIFNDDDFYNDIEKDFINNLDGIIEEFDNLKFDIDEFYNECSCIINNDSIPSMMNKDSNLSIEDIDGIDESMLSPINKEPTYELSKWFEAYLYANYLDNFKNMNYKHLFLLTFNFKSMQFFNFNFNFKNVNMNLFYFKVSFYNFNLFIFKLMNFTVFYFTFTPNNRLCNDYPKTINKFKSLSVNKEQSHELSKWFLLYLYSKYLINYNNFNYKHLFLLTFNFKSMQFFNFNFNFKNVNMNLFYFKFSFYNFNLIIFKLMNATVFYFTFNPNKRLCNDYYRKINKIVLHDLIDIVKEIKQIKSNKKILLKDLIDRVKEINEENKIKQMEESLIDNISKDTIEESKEEIDNLQEIEKQIKKIITNKNLLLDDIIEKSIEENKKLKEENKIKQSIKEYKIIEQLTSNLEILFLRNVFYNYLNNYDDDELMSTKPFVELIEENKLKQIEEKRLINCIKFRYKLVLYDLRVRVKEIKQIKSNKKRLLDELISTFNKDDEDESDNKDDEDESDDKDNNDDKDESDDKDNEDDNSGNDNNNNINDDDPDTDNDNSYNDDDGDDYSDYENDSQSDRDGHYGEYDAYKLKELLSNNKYKNTKIKLRFDIILKKHDEVISLLNKLNKIKDSNKLDKQKVYNKINQYENILNKIYTKMKNIKLEIDNFEKLKAKKQNKHNDKCRKDENLKNYKNNKVVTNTKINKLEVEKINKKNDKCPPK